jgi:small subunit ribosomal protein S9
MYLKMKTTVIKTDLNLNILIIGKNQFPMPKNKKQETDKKPEKKNEKKTEFYQAVGRRKSATARVKLFVSGENEVTLKNSVIKAGDIIINYKPAEKYFSGEVFKKYYLEPFRVTNTSGRFAVSALIEGGGPAGQVGAFIHGVSRALVKADKDKFRVLLKKRGFLTRDPREKERRKAGNAQKARAKKQSPKR